MSSALPVEESGEKNAVATPPAPPSTTAGAAAASSLADAVGALDVASTAAATNVTPAADDQHDDRPELMIFYDR